MNDTRFNEDAYDIERLHCPIEFLDDNENEKKNVGSGEEIPYILEQILPSGKNKIDQRKVKGIIAAIIAVALIVLTAVIGSGMLGNGAMYFIAAEGAVAVMIAVIFALYFCCSKEKMIEKSEL